MKITAKYYNIIRDMAGKQEDTLEMTAGDSVAAALTVIAKHYGTAMEKLLLASSGEKSTYLSLFLNKRRLGNADLSETLAEGDELMLMPAIAGGCGAT